MHVVLVIVLPVTFTVVAGVIVAGSKTSEIFIENGRFHGKQIAEDLKKRLATQRIVGSP